MTEHERCPQCGANLNPDPRTVYTFSKWATPLIVVLLSLMLLAIDFIDDGAITEQPGERIDWGHWATLGVWMFYISVQLFRSRPNYRWLMIPFSGIIFSIFVILIDWSRPPNEGFWGLDWSLYVVVPFLTFLVALPIVGRIARVQPTYQDQLEYLVETLAEEQENGN